jgi:two-component system phosphate regulon response regulator PhoB
VGPTRIVLIEEGSLIERLASLLERSENETAAPHSDNGRVCEAHILAPNLILLELTHGCDHTEALRQLRESATSRDVPAIQLELTKQQRCNRATDVPASVGAQEGSEPDLASDDSLALPEPMPDSSSPEQLEPVLQIGPVRIDRHGHWAYLHEKKLHLTPTEFRLLECFLREPGRAFTRSQLLDVSIGNASFVLERTIDVHIRSLRTKMGGARELIETVRGVGYRFRENEDLQ